MPHPLARQHPSASSTLRDYFKKLEAKRGRAVIRLPFFFLFFSFPHSPLFPFPPRRCVEGRALLSKRKGRKPIATYYRPRRGRSLCVQPRFYLLKRSFFLRVYLNKTRLFPKLFIFLSRVRCDRSLRNKSKSIWGTKLDIIGNAI